MFADVVVHDGFGWTHGLIGLLVFIIVVVFLLRILGGAAGPVTGPTPWYGVWGPIHWLVSLIVFLIVLGILLRLIGVWV
jgi:hypothetical protein